MRVLIVHNRYREALPSGENRIVDDELAALQEHGIDARSFSRASDEIDGMSIRKRLGAVTSPLTGRTTRQSLVNVLEDFRPDVVHLHNPYPLISPEVINWSADRGIRVVATIHNFRLRCMNGLFFRDGSICEACDSHRSSLPGVIHACYQNSRSRSAVMAVALAKHRSAWERVTTYVAVSDFIADRLRAWGIPSHKIIVKPNPVSDPGVPIPVGEGFLYAGRLSEEKGTMLLLDAWQESGLDGTVPLRVAGDGPLRHEVAARASRLTSVELLGVRTPSEIASHRRQSAVGVFCSLWYEAHPAVAESYACGRPVLATSVGALGTVVDQSVGWLAAPTTEAFAAGFVAASSRPDQEQRGTAARDRFNLTYRSDIVISRLIDIYSNAMAQEV